MSWRQLNRFKDYPRYIFLLESLPTRFIPEDRFSKAIHSLSGLLSRLRRFTSTKASAISTYLAGKGLWLYPTIISILSTVYDLHTSLCSPRPLRTMKSMPGLGTSRTRQHTIPALMSESNDLVTRRSSRIKKLASDNRLEEDVHTTQDGNNQSCGPVKSLICSKELMDRLSHLVVEGGDGEDGLILNSAGQLLTIRLQFQGL